MSLRSVIISQGMPLWLSFAAVGCFQETPSQKQVPHAKADEPKPPAAVARGLQVLSGSSIPPRLYTRVRVLSVGINAYKSLSVPRLEWAENDARSVGELLEKRYGYKVDLLLGRQARRAAIYDMLDAYQTGQSPEGSDAVSQPLGEEDALLIFFAGHGYTVDLDGFGRKGFLLPYDADLNPDTQRDAKEWAEKAIDMDELGNRVRAIRARHVFVIADACYSGFLGKRSGIGSRIDLQSLALRNSRMVMTAGTEDQQAIERPDLKHGIFSDALIRQLYTDDALSAREVFIGVRDEVARRSEGRMLPQLREFVIDNGEFIFLPKELPVQEVQVALKDVNQRLKAAATAATKPVDVYRASSTYNYRYSTRAETLTREWTKRFQRFVENASLGDANAMAALTYCYHAGLGVEADDKKAFESAHRAYDSEQPIGRHVLGEAYLKGWGIGKNELQGRQLIEEAAKQNCMLSKYAVARFRMDEWEESPKVATRDEILKDLEAAASDGVLSAQHALANCLLSGDFGVTADPQRAFELARTAAQGEFADACAMLAELYRTGIPAVLERDYPESHAWLLKAADSGHPGAQYELARRHYGEFPEEQFPAKVMEARRWAEFADQQGIHQATTLVGDMYANARGVQRDDKRAVAYYEQATEKGNADAAYRLARWYMEGRGVNMDAEKALLFGERAGQLGHPDGWWLAGWQLMDRFDRKVNHPKTMVLDKNLKAYNSSLSGWTEDTNYWLRKAADVWIRGLEEGSELVIPCLINGIGAGTNASVNDVQLEKLLSLRTSSEEPPDRPRFFIDIVYQEKAIVSELIRKEIVLAGRGSRPFIGMSLVDAPPKLRKKLGLPESDLPITTFVHTNSPAAKAGVQEFDAILEINAIKTATSQQAKSIVRSLRPGIESTFKIRHVDEEGSWTTREVKIVPTTADSTPSP